MRGVRQSWEGAKRNQLNRLSRRAAPVFVNRLHAAPPHDTLSILRPDRDSQAVPVSHSILLVVLPDISSFPEGLPFAFPLLPPLLPKGILRVRKPGHHGHVLSLDCAQVDIDLAKHPRANQHFLLVLPHGCLPFPPVACPAVLLSAIKRRPPVVLRNRQGLDKGNPKDVCELRCSLQPYGFHSTANHLCQAVPGRNPRLVHC